MKLALAQMRVRPGEVDINLARAREVVAAAAAGGADLVLLPEALPFGWMDPSANGAAGAVPEGRHFQAFASWARENKVYLCSGLVERCGSTLFNAAVLISPEGKLLLHHRKIHELAIAHNCYGLGDRLGVVDTEHGRLGVAICADGFAPGQVITRSLALMGAQLILSPSAWAVPPEHDNAATPYGKLWIDNYGAVARKYNTWIAGCSNVGAIRSGPWGGHKCIGCSLLIGPGGVIKIQGPYGENAEETIFADISLSPVTRTSAE